MNLAQSIAVLTLLALPLVTSAQKRDQTEGDDKSNRTTQLIRESWQHVAFHAITELQDQEIPQTLENQTFGFGLTYMKHDRSGLFDGGLDLGVQPFGTRTLSETLWSEIEEDSVQADVTLRSNMVRAHYVLRTTLFKNRLHTSVVAERVGQRRDFSRSVPLRKRRRKHGWNRDFSLS